jgi:hypothetical protein
MEQLGGDVQLFLPTNIPIFSGTIYVWSVLFQLNLLESYCQNILVHIYVYMYLVIIYKIVKFFTDILKS